MNIRHKRKEKEESVSTARELFQWVAAIVAAVLIALAIDNFVIVNAQIPSGSMENTIMTGDRVIGNRFAYSFSDPQRFDIIIFRYPDDESQLFIKRIIGLPGETVEIRDGKIYLNGSDEPLEDVQTKETMVGSFGPYTVPENSYFVMGDNRNDSKDSRYWTNTFVTKDEIVDNDYTFSFGRYCAMKIEDDDGEPMEEKISHILTEGNNEAYQSRYSRHRECGRRYIQSAGDELPQNRAVLRRIHRYYKNTQQKP